MRTRIGSHTRDSIERWDGSRTHMSGDSRTRDGSHMREGNTCRWGRLLVVGWIVVGVVWIAAVCPAACR